MQHAFSSIQHAMTAGRITFSADVSGRLKRNPMLGKWRLGRPSEAQRSCMETHTAQGMQVSGSQYCDIAGGDFGEPTSESEPLCLPISRVT